MILTKKILQGTVFVFLTVGWSYGQTEANQSPEKVWAGLADSLLPEDSAGGMVREDVRTRLGEANQRESQAWYKLHNKDDWEAYKFARVEALRKSLGSSLSVPKDLTIIETRKFPGEGFFIKNLLFESRPGLWVTANLYLPAKKTKSMPGILICHSHHNPKTQSELQVMGMTWARNGCAVLVMDQLGHGERRQHPFVNAQSYPGPFRVGRQDYYFRYNVGMQLHLVGESLMGWMAWDLMRGVDVLHSLPNIDKNKIILLGAVAGGGDPVAVTAALDKRISAVVPFNFGGPQPESPFPLPKNAEEEFNYAGSGSWESTRNLRLSAKEGFLPWVIVGSVAPRPVIYAHEFAWDFKRDPVWKRLQKIYKWYGHPDNLAEAHGQGSVKGSSSKDTHCNNIGAVHRQQIYPALKKWFDMPIPKTEYKNRLPTEELLCMTPEVAKKSKLAHQLAYEMAQKQIEEFRKKKKNLSSQKATALLRQKWSQLLGGVSPKNAAYKINKQEVSPRKNLRVERVVLQTERNILVPLLLLIPKEAKKPLPVVVAISQQGKQGFLEHQPAALIQLLEKGVMVCLPDLRGTGETQPGSRGRQSAASSLSASELMLGGTILGVQCRDLLAVLRFLRDRKDVADQQIALWGHSFATPNPANTRFAVPLRTDDLPRQAEPGAALVVLLTALFDEDIRAVRAHGCLGSYLSVLESPFCYVPHDAIIPGVFQTGDIADLAGTLAPRPLLLEGIVDGHNQLAGTRKVKWQPFELTQSVYDAKGARDNVRIYYEGGGKESSVEWLIDRLGE